MLNLLRSLLPAPTPGPFLVKPYLQLGHGITPSGKKSLTLLWHTEDADARWSAEIRHAGAWGWHPAGAGAPRRVSAPDAHRVWSVLLANLLPGQEFDYRLLREGREVFGARARAPRSADQPHRFVVAGDCGAGTEGQRAVAYQMGMARPDFVFVPGDIVYDRGLVSEYRRKFFPVYNAEEASPRVGAPLLRSTLFVAAPGNHDVAGSDLGRYEDGLAYFLYWQQPLNGPFGRAGAHNTPRTSGNAARERAFREAAGSAYPRMANFSFDYGNAHWLILDANGYLDGTDPGLRAWIADDLARARYARWRFVGFHQPGFNSAKDHFDEQQTRLLAPLFEWGRVDIVFSGHVHNYQRTFPLRFAPRRGPGGKWRDSHGHVAGEWEMDRAFDGARNTRPNGVLYLISGGGGAALHSKGLQDRSGSWQPFTSNYVADTHSFTVVDATNDALTLRQVSEDGRELDRFTITR